MESIKIQLCECGCGQPAPIATRNWHKRGIKKGQYLRFVCGHHRRGKEQSADEKIKRVKSWGIDNFAISPYLPGNKIVRYKHGQKRWYCCHRKNSQKPHARLVYEHFYGEIPKDWVIHHKSGSAEKLEDDRPENLLAVPKKWNIHFLPFLAQGFGIPEEKVTQAYILANEERLEMSDQDIFKRICELLLLRGTTHV